MISLHLEEIMLCDKFTSPLFRGVFAADNLPRSVQEPCMLIVNTDPISRKGEHWIAIYIDEFKRAEHFCSYGNLPIEAHKQFLQHQSSTYTCNEVQLQSFFSEVCGEYCLLFLAHRARGLSMQEFLWFFQNRNVNQNDQLVQTLCNEIFKGCLTPVRKAMNKQSCCSRVCNSYHMM